MVPKISNRAVLSISRRAVLYMNHIKAEKLWCCTVLYFALSCKYPLDPYPQRTNDFDDDDEKEEDDGDTTPGRSPLVRIVRVAVSCL